MLHANEKFRVWLKETHLKASVERPHLVLDPVLLEDVH